MPRRQDLGYPWSHGHIRSRRRAGRYSGSRHLVCLRRLSGRRPRASNGLYRDVDKFSECLKVLKIVRLFNLLHYRTWYLVRFGARGDCCRRWRQSDESGWDGGSLHQQPTQMLVQVVARHWRRACLCFIRRGTACGRIGIFSWAGDGVMLVLGASSRRDIERRSGFSRCSRSLHEARDLRLHVPSANTHTPYALDADETLLKSQLSISGVRSSSG